MGLDYLSDNLIELRGPVNVAAGAAVSQIGSGSSVTAKLYDTALDGRVARFNTVATADALASQSSIFVQDRTPILVGTTLEVRLDDGTLWKPTVNTIPGSVGEVDMTSALPASVSSGAIVTVTSYPGGLLIIPIDDFSGWKDGMNMELTIDDGTLRERTVSLINRDAGYLTISSSLITGISPGAIIKRKLGADLTTFANYGTFPTSSPVAGDAAWGMRDVIEFDHADLALGMRVRGEITLIDSTPTPDLNLTRKVVATVINQ